MKTIIEIPDFTVESLIQAGYKKSRHSLPGFFVEIKIQSLHDFHQRNDIRLTNKRSFPEPECF
jgi:hypothetical protein